MKLLFENWRKYLSEQSVQYEIYCDMDGVLVDFIGGTVEYINKKLKSGEAEELKTKIGRDYVMPEDIEKSSPNTNKDVKKYMYNELKHNAGFWENLSWHPGGKELWSFMSKLNPNILTAGMGYGSEIGKQAWIDKNLQPPPVDVLMSQEKYRRASPTRILIDDTVKHVLKWESANGISILHTDASSTIAKLKSLGVEGKE